MTISIVVQLFFFSPIFLLPSGQIPVQSQQRTLLQSTIFMFKLSKITLEQLYLERYFTDFEHVFAYWLCVTKRKQTNLLKVTQQYTSERQYSEFKQAFC